MFYIIFKKNSLSYLYRCLTLNKILRFKKDSRHESTRWHTKWFFSISLLKLIIINSSWWLQSCRLCLVYSLRVSPTRLATNWQAGGLNGDPAKCEPVSWTTSAIIALSTLWSTDTTTLCGKNRLSAVIHVSIHRAWEHVTFSCADYISRMTQMNSKADFSMTNPYAFIEATFPMWLLADT